MKVKYMLMPQKKCINRSMNIGDIFKDKPAFSLKFGAKASTSLIRAPRKLYCSWTLYNPIFHIHFTYASVWVPPFSQVKEILRGKRFPAFFCERSFYRTVFKLCFVRTRMKRTCILYNLHWLDNSQANSKNCMHTLMLKVKKAVLFYEIHLIIESNENICISK